MSFCTQQKRRKYLEGKSTKKEKKVKKGKCTSTSTSNDDGDSDATALAFQSNDKDTLRLQKLKRSMACKRSDLLRRANIKEENEIRKLEKKLKLKAGNTLPKAFESDGLNYLLEVCSDRNVDDSTARSKIRRKEVKTDVDSDSNDKLGAVDDKNLTDYQSRQRKRKRKIDEKTITFSGVDEICSSADQPTKENSQAEEHQQQQEGIYMPPQKRVKLLSTDATWNEENENGDSIKKLYKRVKGLLNRLAESNIRSITTQIENLYGVNSRHDMNLVITKLLMESLVTQVSSSNRMIIEHAVLICVLNVNIGNEVGAYILENLVERFNNLWYDLLTEDKRSDNIIMLIIQLYNFKVVKSTLVFDMIEKLSQRLLEKEIELLIIILKNVGFNLRKDDPLRLKELIISIQKKASYAEVENGHHKQQFGSRVKFMLDTLLAIKNNNLLKISNEHFDYIERLKKLVKSMFHPGKYTTELSLTLEDLSNVKEKGRWWLVGSASCGGGGGGGGGRIVPPDSSAADIFSKDVLRSAREHRMNTDVRKNVFCILLSAQDFSDAFGKLTKLRLKSQQYQEIFHVLLYCLLRENNYNPYYSFVAERFCSANMKYQLALRYAIWDKLKEIQSFSDNEISNFAKFSAYLFLEKKLPLSILKVVNFTELDKPLIKFLRRILLAVLLVEDENIITQIFVEISKKDYLFMFREGILLFLHRFMLKNSPHNLSTTSTRRIQLVENIMRGLHSEETTPSSVFVEYT